MTKEQHLALAQEFSMQQGDCTPVYFLGFWRGYGISDTNAYSEEEEEEWDDEYPQHIPAPPCSTGYPSVIMTNENEVRYSLGDEYFQILEELGLLE